MESREKPAFAWVSYLVKSQNFHIMWATFTAWRLQNAVDASTTTTLSRRNLLKTDGRGSRPRNAAGALRRVRSTISTTTPPSRVSLPRELGRVSPKSHVHRAAVPPSPQPALCYGSTSTSSVEEDHPHPSAVENVVTADVDDVVDDARVMVDALDYVNDEDDDDDDDGQRSDCDALRNAERGYHLEADDASAIMETVDGVNDSDEHFFYGEALNSAAHKYHLKADDACAIVETMDNVGDDDDEQRIDGGALGSADHEYHLETDDACVIVEVTDNEGVDGDDGDEQHIDGRVLGNAEHKYHLEADDARVMVEAAGNDNDDGQLVDSVDLGNAEHEYHLEADDARVIVELINNVDDDGDDARVIVDLINNVDDDGEDDDGEDDEYIDSAALSNSGDQHTYQLVAAPTQITERIRAVNHVHTLLDTPSHDSNTTINLHCSPLARTGDVLDFSCAMDSPSRESDTATLTSFDARQAHAQFQQINHIGSHVARVPSDTLGRSLESDTTLLTAHFQSLEPDSTNNAACSNGAVATSYTKELLSVASIQGEQLLATIEIVPNNDGAANPLDSDSVIPPLHTMDPTVTPAQHGLRMHGLTVEIPPDTPECSRGSDGAGVVAVPLSTQSGRVTGLTVEIPPDTPGRSLESDTTIMNLHNTNTTDDGVGVSRRVLGLSGGIPSGTELESGTALSAGRDFASEVTININTSNSFALSARPSLESEATINVNNDNPSTQTSPNPAPPARPSGLTVDIPPDTPGRDTAVEEDAATVCATPSVIDEQFIPAQFPYPRSMLVTPHLTPKHLSTLPRVISLLPPPSPTYGNAPFQDHQSLLYTNLLEHHGYTMFPSSSSSSYQHMPHNNPGMISSSSSSHYQMVIGGANVATSSSSSRRLSSNSLFVPSREMSPKGPATFPFPNFVMTESPKHSSTTPSPFAVSPSSKCTATFPGFVENEESLPASPKAFASTCATLEKTVPEHQAEQKPEQQPEQKPEKKPGQKPKPKLKSKSKSEPKQKLKGQLIVSPRLRLQKLLKAPRSPKHQYPVLPPSSGLVSPDGCVKFCSKVKQGAGEKQRISQAKRWSNFLDRQHVSQSNQNVDRKTQLERQCREYEKKHVELEEELKLRTTELEQSRRISQRLSKEKRTAAWQAKKSEEEKREAETLRSQFEEMRSECQQARNECQAESIKFKECRSSLGSIEAELFSCQQQAQASLNLWNQMTNQRMYLTGYQAARALQATPWPSSSLPMAMSHTSPFPSPTVATVMRAPPTVPPFPAPAVTASVRHTSLPLGYMPFPPAPHARTPYFPDDGLNTSYASPTVPPPHRPDRVSSPRPTVPLHNNNVCSAPKSSCVPLYSCTPPQRNTLLSAQNYIGAPLCGSIIHNNVGTIAAMQSSNPLPSWRRMDGSATSSWQSTQQGMECDTTGASGAASRDGSGTKGFPIVMRSPSAGALNAQMHHAPHPDTSLSFRPPPRLLTLPYSPLAASRKTPPRTRPSPETPSTRSVARSATPPPLLSLATKNPRHISSHVATTLQRASGTASFAFTPPRAGNSITSAPNTRVSAVVIPPPCTTMPQSPHARPTTPRCPPVGAPAQLPTGRFITASSPALQTVGYSSPRVSFGSIRGPPAYTAPGTGGAPRTVWNDLAIGDGRVAQWFFGNSGASVEGAFDKGWVSVGPGVLRGALPQQCVMGGFPSDVIDADDGHHGGRPGATTNGNGRSGFTFLST